MARSLHRDPSISVRNDASCINNRRGMAKRAKRNSNKRDRQTLKREMVNTMTKDNLIDLLNSDIRNEYAHMHFYLHSALLVQGLHREELKEFFLEEAAGEMKHVQEFGDLIVGLGGRPESLPHPFPANLTDPMDILTHALAMEEHVVGNYVTRMDQAAELGGVDGRWVEIFLEAQIVKSREDADHIKQLLAGK